MGPSQLPFLQDRAERLEAQIERWEAKEQTESRIAKLERKRARLANTNAKIDRITHEAELQAQRDAEIADSLLPRDTFEISYDAARGGFEIAVSDSVFDDSFTGGDPLIFRSSSTTQTTRGSRSKTSTGSLANGNYWSATTGPDGVAQQTLFIGGSFYGGLDAVDSLTAYVIKDNGDGFPLAVSDEDILALDTLV